VSNASQSSGSLDRGNREVLVQTGTYLESAADVKRKLVVAVRGEAGSRKPVFMSDVAEVRTAPTSRRITSGSAARMANSPRSPVQLSKKPGVNAADVANAVIDRINRAAP
jgi:multidrug efflux pump subunit AcrB